MAADRTRREFLAGASGISLAALAGCVGTVLPGSAGTPDTPDTTLYVGAYHWGFVLLDETGVRRDHVSLALGSVVRFVAFGLEASGAIATLPDAVQSNLPSHAGLEGQNLERIPAPSEDFLHDALEEAEEKYPTHSLLVVPAGTERQGGMMDGGMMDGGMMGRRGLLLPQDAAEPSTMTIKARSRGNFSLDCGAYCGYGHRYMNEPGILTVK